MRRLFLASGLLLSLILSTPSFSQISNATVSGTIDDVTGAVLPSVTVTAANTGTGVVTSALTNEAGAYNFASLLPGVYRVTAELPGFQTKSYTDVQLGNAQTVRLNFTLSVSGGNTAVEVTVAVDTLLATSSSVGEVLSRDKGNLPVVGNNVLDLTRVLAGTRMDDNGVTGTFAGMSNYNINVQRDGIDSSASARYMQAGIQTSTLMNPDLVEEIRLIVAPVDAEMGRGNGQMIVQTRSGTNQLKGSAVWSVRNSALDANTWNNNRQVDPRTGEWKTILPDWTNRNQYTMNVGGPIVKNKTFFFALWDGLIISRRAIQNPMVLTPCARNGIFRYFDTRNNDNALQLTSLGATRTIDSTGFVTKLLGKMPLPNNYEIGDGLNTAGYRWLRREPRGSENVFGFATDGLFGGIERKQANFKFDHNFNATNKVAVTYTYEADDGGANLMTWTDKFGCKAYRRLQHLSFNFVSTLYATLVNEVRAGMRR